MTADPKNDDRSIHVQGNVERSAVVLGDGNTVTYTTNVFGSFEAEQFPARPSQQLSQQEYRWRQVLVQNVKHYWIEGVLERSLHNQALIELGLEEQGQAVASPVRGAEEFTQENEQSFPAGTQASDIFDGLGAGRTLLILGEPGAGKTTTLLKIVKTLLKRIGDDFSQPIPVVLNLSSWSKQRKNIAEWLVQDLYETFQVSKEIGETWIKEEQLTLCLDGLDEVAVQYRNDCVQALNYFLQDHGRTELIVCSRIRDYEALSEQLRVRSAIYIQSLTSGQIDQYLERAGEQLSTLKVVLSQNAEIREFAASPLILSVMGLAYRGYSLDDFPAVGSTHLFRQRLFETYVDRMFRRRGATAQYSQVQAKRWLIWLSQQMVKRSQTIFFIEEIQPSWLDTKFQRILYSLQSSLLFWPILSPIVGLMAGLEVGLFFGLILALILALPFAILGLFAGLFEVWIPRGLDEIKPVATFKWSKWSLKESQNALRRELLFELLFWLLFGLLFGVVFRSLYWLSVGFVTALAYFLISGVTGGFRGSDIQKRVEPNHAIRKSVRSTVILILFCAPLIGLVFATFSDPTFATFSGLIFGITIAMAVSGSDWLYHLSLRLMLYRMGYMPWNYARFLDYAAERLFLQKVGGGYIFIHRMLLEHFDQMELEQKPSK